MRTRCAGPRSTTRSSLPLGRRRRREVDGGNDERPVLVGRTSCRRRHCTGTVLRLTMSLRLRRHNKVRGRRGLVRFGQWRYRRDACRFTVVPFPAACNCSSTVLLSNELGRLGRHVACTATSPQLTARMAMGESGRRCRAGRCGKRHGITRAGRWGPSSGTGGRR